MRTASYDASGTMMCRAPSTATMCSGTPTSAQLSYDTEGRLTAWQHTPSSPTTTDVFAYGGAGQRVEQQAVQSGATTTWVSVGALAEYKTTSSGTNLYKYYSFAGRHVASEGLTARHYFLTDQVGSIQVEVTTSGSAEGVSLRKPFGQTRYGSNSFLFTGFTGQLKDDVINLVYFNARYYDQDAATFISADTVLPGGGYDPWGLSRYAYTEDNPETHTDPSGHRLIMTDQGGGGQPPRKPRSHWANQGDWLLENQFNWPYANWREYRDFDNDPKSGEDKVGQALLHYFGFQGYGPSVWKIAAANNEFGTTADYVVGLEKPVFIPNPDEPIFPYVVPEIDPSHATPIELYTPGAGKMGGDREATLVKDAARKGGVAPILVLDVRNFPNYWGDSPEAYEARDSLGRAIINYQPYAEANRSVMRVIFVQNGEIIDDVNPLNYGPLPNAGLLG